MSKLHISRVVRPRSINHAPGHYALGAVKRVARQASASASNKGSDVDAREAASFMPLGISARVLSWPQL